ncbi:MAG: galactokinase [Bdellovibrionales bacterium]
MIDIQSSTRVDLAGGTLDCWPLYLFVGDCVTVNLSIDVFTGCKLAIRKDNMIEITVTDLKYKKSFSTLNELVNSLDPEVQLLKEVALFFNPKFGFELQTYSQSPVGGGLGGSSSLCVSLIKAFCENNGTKLTTDQIVELAHNLEARVLRSPTGTQDYFPAIEPGLNIIHYKASGVHLERPQISLEPLYEKLLLIYTGRSHHSGINNWQVIKKVIDGDIDTLNCLKEIARISADTAEACRKQDWGKLPGLFRNEFDFRIKLSAYFSSPEIEQLKKLVIESGGDAVKICGAGGGGCVLVWAEQKFHERISESCLVNGFRPISLQKSLSI